jgi:hypothetical protein
MRRYSQYSRTPAYTLPSGRQATSREYRERIALLEARDKCPECNRLAEKAVFECDYRPGACQCPAHQSYGR